MSEETVMTPISPEEGGMEPPKATPTPVAADTTAPTVKLKPVIRKPMIRKPVIGGGAKPVTLKPAAGTPPAPAAVPEAAAAAPTPATTPATPQLKAITSPIAAQAILHKTGIIAEGILTPAQAQAAKTKTSRISLESAIGVAPVMKSAAPMKTIRLRRPTDIPGVGKPAPSAAQPAPAPALAPAAAPAPAAPAPAVVADTVSTEAPTIIAATTPVDTTATTVATTPSANATSDASSAITQKKTLKLQRPGFKRPTVSGLRRPGDTAAAPSPTPADASGGDVADLSPVADIADLKTVPSMGAEDDGSTVEGAPGWLNVTTLIAGIAALIVLGLCTWTLFCEAVGPAAGPNDLASFHSDTDYRR